MKYNLAQMGALDIFLSRLSDEEYKVVEKDTKTKHKEQLLQFYHYQVLVFLWIVIIKKLFKHRKQLN